MDSSPKSVSIEYYDTSHIQLKSDSVMNRMRKLDPTIQTKVMAYRKEKDGRMCLVSCLLKEHLVNEEKKEHPTCQLQLNSYGKPFLFNSSLSFNISHHSDVVALAASNDLLVGIDTIAFNPDQPEETTNQFLSLMKSNLHLNELQYLQMFKSTCQRLFFFHLFWSLKEAYLKAIGTGIGNSNYQLNTLDFSRFDKQNDAFCSVKGYWKETCLDDWIFVSIRLSSNHILSVACGPKNDSIDIGNQLQCLSLDNKLLYQSHNGDCNICVMKKNCEVLL